jgi:hypothetical protein
VDIYVGKVVPKTPAAGGKRTQSWRQNLKMEKECTAIDLDRCATDIVGTLSDSDSERLFWMYHVTDHLDVGKCIVSEKNQPWELDRLDLI